MPQDHGNKTDIQWVELTNTEGIGLRFSGDEVFNFRVSEYETDHLTRAQYPYQLRKSGKTIFDMDYEVTGVGETATRTLTKYRVYPNTYSRRIIIEPIFK